MDVRDVRDAPACRPRASLQAGELSRGSRSCCDGYDVERRRVPLWCPGEPALCSRQLHARHSAARSRRRPARAAAHTGCARGGSRLRRPAGGERLQAFRTPLRLGCRRAGEDRHSGKVRPPATPTQLAAPPRWPPGAPSFRRWRLRYGAFCRSLLPARTNAPAPQCTRAGPAGTQ